MIIPQYQLILDLTYDTQELLQKSLVIVYQSATLHEYMMRLDADTPEQKYQYIMSFLRTHSDQEITPDDELLLREQLEEIVIQLGNTYFRMDKKSFGWPSDGVVSPLSSYVAYLCKELCIKPRDLLEYTLAEISYLTEWLTRNTNAQSEEGQKRNRLYAQSLARDHFEVAHKQEIDSFLQS